MVKRNTHFAKLNAGYLFPEINKRKHELLKRVPHAKIISLGIGDTTQPISKHIVQGLVEGARRLGTPEGYSGYGPEQGHEALRNKISKVIYKGEIPPEEIFISDGSKCDIGRLQTLFGKEAVLAVQDPSYPVYVDTGVAVGQTKSFYGDHYQGIVYMQCTPENNFFPDLNKLPHADLIYFCSPNNPTGAAATRSQLEELVAFTKKRNAILIFDAAYSTYIRDSDIPTSIYDIPGARDVAIELNSFSKMAGFTGVRLAWSVVPGTVLYDNGYPVKTDWQRMASTFFNGASNIAQHGGLAALDPEGLIEMRAMTDYYLENARLIKEAFLSFGLPVYGGGSAPYLWVKFPGHKSWDVFSFFLENAHILCTPGVGFGPSGEGFIRLTAFGNRERIIEALERCRECIDNLIKPKVK